MDAFAERTLAWWDVHGRRDLPWQQDKTAYPVWISEVMLQQTQVTTVIPYYQRFIARFPNATSLADAELDEVLHHWTGLGYYARGRNLHKAAIRIRDDHAGELPTSIDAITALPGIGRSTAAAILAISDNQQHAILDGNVKRVLARFHAVAGYPGIARIQTELWHHAQTHTPPVRVSDYTQAIMDLGATCCVRSKPTCTICPHVDHCAAHETGTVDQYPTRKPKKDKPERHARMYLIIRPDGACLLERRPNDGIWGGLWTPPERPADSEAREICELLGVSAETIETITAHPKFRHTFTHFHLHIEPVTVRVTHPPLSARDDDNLRWVTPGTNEGLGLSAPAVKLLSTLTEGFTLT